MNEERMKVLQMVEEQKISVEDAIKLLDAIKFDGAMPGFRHRNRPDCARTNEPDFEDKFQKFAAHVESFAKEVGTKMESSFKVMEPKLKKATQVVVEKTAGIVNDISNALNESVKNFEEKNKNSEANCEPGCDNNCPGDDGPREN